MRFQSKIEIPIHSAPQSVANENLLVQKTRAELTKAMPKTAEPTQKEMILREILKSKNDNDPRLDQDFNHLTQDEKLRLQDIYRELPQERLNDRGIIVLILSRNIDAPEDFDFLIQLFREPSCLSLENCKHAVVDNDEHGESGSAVTLNYPQLVALEKLKAWRLSHKELTENLKQAFNKTIQEAQHSESAIVSQVAHDLIP